MGVGKHRSYILAAAFLWGCTGVYFKELSARGAMPMQAVFLRTSIAMLGLGLWMLLKNRKAFLVRPKDFWCFIGTGLLSLLFFNWCFFGAITETGMAVAGVLLYTAPAFVTFLSALLFKEKLRLPGWAVLVIILSGCALTSGVAGGVSGVSTAGILYGLGSGLGYALYSIFGRYALNRGYSPQTISFYTFALCALGSMPFALTSPGMGLPSLFMSSPGVWACALALGILGCLMPYWLYTNGLSGVTGATASMTATLEPVVAALFGVFLYREALTIWQGSGMILVLGGILLLAITTESRQKKPR
jgi:drug/metabolite transporter (DMT)-like permease